MIKGVGIDIIEIDRIEKELQKHSKRFTTRVFSPQEVEYCESMAKPAQHYAARFAAKEAAFKALGTGWQKGVSWHDVVIINDELGQPVVVLSGRAKDWAEKMEVVRTHISISHSDHNAIATVILES